MSKKILKQWLIVGACMFVAGCLYSCDRQEPVITVSHESGLPEASSEAGLLVTEDETRVKTIFVHVCGSVRAEGVYEIPEGSRCMDAVEAAGGFADYADRTYLNLAEPVRDGQKIYVPTRDESALWQEESREAEAGLVDINTASRDELMTLSGIGEARADEIITYRENNGPFESIEDIMNVPGIKESAFQKIKARIKVGRSYGEQSIGSG